MTIIIADTIIIGTDQGTPFYEQHMGRRLGISLKAMAVNSIPTQTLMSIHPKYGVTWTREIQLCDRIHGWEKLKYGEATRCRNES